MPIFTFKENERFEPNSTEISKRYNQEKSQEKPEVRIIKKYPEKEIQPIDLTYHTVKEIDNTKDPVRFQAIELKSLEESSEKSIYICNQFTVQTIDALYSRGILKEGDPAPAATIFANGQRVGGHGPGARAQEEGTLNDSDLPTHMPSAYPDNDIYTLGGVMGVTDAKTNIKNNAFNATFIAMPYLVHNYEDHGIPIKTQLQMSQDIYTFPERAYFVSEKEFDDDAYLEHLIGLTMLEFAMAKAMEASVVIGGLKGCGVFKNRPECIAAAYHAVANRPEFEGMTLVLGLGTDTTPHKQNLSNYKIFETIDDDLFKNTTKILSEKFDENISPEALSTQVTDFFVEKREAYLKEHHEHLIPAKLSKVEIAARLKRKVLHTNQPKSLHDIISKFDKWIKDNYLNDFYVTGSHNVYKGNEISNTYSILIRLAQLKIMETSLEKPTELSEEIETFLKEPVQDPKKEVLKKGAKFFAKLAGKSISDMDAARNAFFEDLTNPTKKEDAKTKIEVATNNLKLKLEKKEKVSLKK